MFNITTLGYVLIFVLILLSMLLAALFSSGNKKWINGSQMILSILCMAVAFLAGNITIYQMSMGGEVTLCSMFFITYIGYLYGIYVGIFSAIAYGLLQLVTDSYIISISQLLWDYIFAFGILGISGLLSEKKWGMQLGFLAGVAGRFLISVLSGVLFFRAYVPEGMQPLVYSVFYNGTYIGAEAVLTMGIISIPPVTRALTRLKFMVQGENAGNLQGSSNAAGMEDLPHRRNH